MDSIESLPTDKNSTTVKEDIIMNEFFPRNVTIIEEFYGKFNYLITLGVLFFIFSLQQVDELLIKFYPNIGNSKYLLLGAKSVIFTIIYFMICNFHLIRKN